MEGGRKRDKLGALVWEGREGERGGTRERGEREGSRTRDTKGERMHVRVTVRTEGDRRRGEGER